MQVHLQLHLADEQVAKIAAAHGGEPDVPTITSWAEKVLSENVHSCCGHKHAAAPAPKAAKKATRKKKA